MKITRFSPPAGLDDFGSATMLAAYSSHVSGVFDVSIASVNSVLAAGDTPQIYNPATHGLTDADTRKTISWNGFPRRFAPKKPGDAPDYAAAEKLQAGGGIHFRAQDEYLEWFARVDANGKIVRVDLTCEAYDYYEFLAAQNPQAVVDLYKQHVDPGAKHGDLFKSGKYDPWNDLNTRRGAMHLTHPANALAAEIKLAADATVRRRDAHGAEPASATALIQCAQFGDGARNSDPKIGFEVNQLARAGFAITLTDPVGLYMVSFDDTGWTFADSSPASGFFRVVRGAFPRAVRAVFELPAAEKAKGRTVSDVLIGGTPISFAGQIAEHITMGIEGAACRPGTMHDALVDCGVVPQTMAGIKLPSRI